jgi:hypothetical protein
VTDGSSMAPEQGAGNRVLRFALVAESNVLPSWQARCLSELLRSGRVELAGVLRPRIRSGVEPRWWRLFSSMVDRRSEAMDPVNVDDVLGDTPILDVDSSEGSHSELDFILAFESEQVHRSLLSVARHGVWVFHFHDTVEYRGGPPALQEILAGDEVTGAVLERLTEDPDAGVVLHRGYFRTFRHSYRVSRDEALLGCVDWPARVCNDLRADSASYLESPATRARLRARIPSLAQMAKLLAITARSLVRFQLSVLLRAETWNVGILHGTRGELLENGGSSTSVTWLPEHDRNEYFADPFPFHSNGRSAILGEVFDFRRGKGVIAVVPIEAGRPKTPPRVVLELDVHASYPCVVNDGDDTFFVPETADAGEVSLYRLEEFPNKWVREATLIEGFPALDPTVFRHGGRWWLTCASKETGKDSKLFAWSALELLGPWVPHPTNPIKTDVRSSRPAGLPFVHDGVLYRPAQDASRAYGGSVVLNRINRLTPDAFDEDTVGRLDARPGPFEDGLHTLSVDDVLTLIDGKSYRFVWASTKAELTRRLRRLRRGRAA